MNENTTSCVFRAFTSKGRKPADEKVGGGEEEPKEDENPSESPELFESFKFGSILEEDIISFEHILLELARSCLSRLSLFFVSVENTLGLGGH